MTAVAERIAAADTAPKAKLRRKMALSLKFTFAFIGLVSFVLIVNGAVNLWLSYDEAKHAAVRVQQEKAQAAADRIDLFVAEIGSCARRRRSPSSSMSTAPARNS
jgi:hypothetical protein